MRPPPAKTQLLHLHWWMHLLQWESLQKERAALAWLLQTHKLCAEELTEGLGGIAKQIGTLTSAHAADAAALALARHHG